MGPGEPVKMDGEISVLPAKPGSVEMKTNRIGVEFNIKLSDKQVFESVWMRKVGNGTVILEVLPHINNSLLYLDQWRGVSTNEYMF